MKFGWRIAVHSPIVGCGNLPLVQSTGLERCTNARLLIHQVNSVLLRALRSFLADVVGILQAKPKTSV